MSFKTFFYKNILMGFFVATTCICAAMAILGMLFEPDMRFNYQGLFSPLIFGAVAMLPTLVNYSKYELSVREALVRKLLQLVLPDITIVSAPTHSRHKNPARPRIKKQNRALYPQP